MKLHRVPLAAFIVLAGACATTPAPPPVETVPPPTTPETPATRLPPIPAVDGALQLSVAYPTEGASIAASDSNFIFGSTGSGMAMLTINGAPVDVAPNGAFLAFISVPADGVYRLSAVREGQTASLERTVRVPDGAAAQPDVIRAPYPEGTISVENGEPVEFGLRAPPGARAFMLLPDGRRLPLVEQDVGVAGVPGDEFRADMSVQRRTATSVRYAALIPMTTSIVAQDTSLARPAIGAFDTFVRSDGPLGAPAMHNASLEVVVGFDTIRQPLRLNVGIVPRDVPRVGIVAAPFDAPHDWTIRGRVDTSGPYHFFWPPGTHLAITGERNGMYRVRLSEDRIAWVPGTDVRLLPAGAAPAHAVVNAVRFAPQSQFIDLRIPVGQRLPFEVVEEEDVLHVDVFGAVSRINFFQYGGLDPLVARAGWSQPADDVLRVTVRLAEPVWGYAPFYDASGALNVRIRRPPVIDPAAPLRGLYIGVDAGHGGSDRNTRGPTDLREADANLSIALQLQALLQQAGARVMMTRTADATVELNSRPSMAADSGVHILVSVHNNAFPDGVNPWTNNGTSAYYYHPHSADLARLMQRELLEELRLRDIGYGRADLALVRPTWMPAVLTETMFMMIPEQESALRDPGVQQRIAAAHVRALEAFLRGRARN